MAFQVADDLLDLLGREDTAGKTLGTDLEQLKLTLPLIHMLDRVPADEADRLRQVLRNGTPHKRAAVAAALQWTESVAYAREQAAAFAAEAAAELDCLPPSECRELLRALTQWAVRREK
jgi:octaprenyl-diphosphate synthase